MGVQALMETDERASFLHLVAAIRPELHRYCARMTGSAIDGEDVLQETLLKAFAAFPQLAEIANVRAWMFRLAHNHAVDRWRSYEQRARTPQDTLGDRPGDPDEQPDEILARQQALGAALSRFVELPPLQRSCVILKDVLDHSLDEIAAMLATTVPAVQAALHRGRRRLAELQDDVPEPAPISPLTVRYAALFNAHDWDALRELLADDVRLDVVARFTKRGRSEVGTYFGNYARMATWRATPGWLDGREVLAVSRAGETMPAYYIELGAEDELVTSIRDFHHVAYVADSGGRFVACSWPRVLGQR